MKNKTLWLLALGLAGVCAWSAWNFTQQSQPKSIIGIQNSGVVLTVNQLPLLYWGNLENFGDLGLQIKTHLRQNLAEVTVGETVRYNGLSYTQVQPGLFLVRLGSQRVFIFTDPFKPEDLNPNVALEFKSDWTVLQRSSLLPDAWPEPLRGWVVLGPQISESLETLSLQSQKPVVRPESAGTVWLKKTPDAAWQVLKP